MFVKNVNTWRRLCLLVAIIVTMHAILPAAAQGDPLSVAPHLGYGVHYAPNTSVSSGYVSQLGFNWVKVYQLDDAYRFPNQKVLYRWDMPYPNNWNDFKRAISDKARAIAGSPVDAVEVHNEPNLSIEWGNRQPNAWQYTQMLRVVYGIVKAIKPSLIVVSGGLAPTITTPDRMAVNDLEFAREMFENGAGRYFDVFGYHPYGFNAEPEADPNGPQPLVFRRTERMRALMEEYGIYKQMWLTEFGWMRDPNEDGVPCFSGGWDMGGFAWLVVSGRQQADYLVRAFDYAHENWPWAGPMFVWNLNWQQAEWLDICSHMRWFGLLDTQGQPTRAFRALQSMKRYPGETPRLWREDRPLRGDVPLFCTGRYKVGEFVIHNIGYPAPIELNIQPVNNGTVFLEVEPARARAGETISVYANPSTLTAPGQYPIYINVRATVNGRSLSQSIQGIVTAWNREGNC